MPNSDLVQNQDLARSCCCSITTQPQPQPPCPQPPAPPTDPAYIYPWCPPYAPPPPPYPYPYPDCLCPCQPVPPTSVEAQIEKLAKKSSVIRKMITNLTQKNKSILVSIGGSQYNFGCYLDTDGDITVYGEDVLENLLEVELAAIKSKISELTDDLVADTDSPVGTETTVL